MLITKITLPAETVEKEIIASLDMKRNQNVEMGCHVGTSLKEDASSIILQKL